MYPRLLVNIEKLKHNAKELNKMLVSANITTRYLVTKVLSGNLEIVEELVNCGFTHIADSRVKNLKVYENLNIPKVLLRIPSLTEINDVVKYSDISLNSEVETIERLNQEAKKQNKIHNIILMFDLGDLREGIYFDSDYKTKVVDILKFKNIKLLGIGTNLTCYGGVIPTKENLQRLVTIKEDIENNFKIKLEVISGGNSSSIPLLLKNELPKEINNLRIGEAIFFGRETAYGKRIKNLYSDIFTLQAQVIEVKQKPSYPLGELGVNSFGEKPKIKDQGQMMRGIVGLGKQDILPENLFPTNKNIKIIDASSDHLICNFNNTVQKVGSLITFNVNYPGLLQLMTSKYIKCISI